jgi:hypothetical protein
MSSSFFLLLVFACFLASNNVGPLVKMVSLVRLSKADLVGLSLCDSAPNILILIGLTVFSFYTNLGFCALCFFFFVGLALEGLIASNGWRFSLPEEGQIFKLNFPGEFSFC